MICGIDPGATSGGIAFIYEDGLAGAEPMPTIQRFAEIMAELPIQHVFLERSQAFPKQGVSSTFSYGDHYGQLQGVLVALKIPHTLVRPQTWAKVMHAGTKGGDTKARSFEAASRLFPGVRLIPAGSRAKKAHMGMVEALLIAEYGRRILGLKASAS